MHRARIGVDLDCGGGTFINPARKGIQGSGSALAADGATFGGGIFLNRGFHAEGEVRLSRAHVRDDLDCSGATFLNGLAQTEAGSGTALNADGINVAGSIFLRGVRAEGEIRLPRGKVGADIDCTAAKIANPFRWGPTGSAAALTMEGSVVGGNVVFNGQFHALGFVTLRGAQITGQLICNGATFENSPPLGAPRRCLPWMRAWRTSHQAFFSVISSAPKAKLGYRLRELGRFSIVTAEHSTILPG